MTSRRSSTAIQPCGPSLEATHPVVRALEHADALSDYRTMSPMTKTEVLDLLEENRDARGEANWKKMGTAQAG